MAEALNHFSWKLFTNNPSELSNPVLLHMIKKSFLQQRFLNGLSDLSLALHVLRRLQACATCSRVRRVATFPISGLWSPPSIEKHLRFKKQTTKKPQQKRPKKYFYDTVEELSKGLLVHLQVSVL